MVSGDLMGGGEGGMSCGKTDPCYPREACQAQLATNISLIIYPFSVAHSKLALPHVAELCEGAPRI